MYLKQLLLLLITLPLHIYAFSQSKTAELNGDCFTAVEIIPEGNFTFKNSPIGYGKKLEFQHNPSNSLYYFEEENNTAWFTFVARESGTLVFKIQPKNVAADFDFLLFEYTDEQFCKDLVNKKIKPIRSNISRNDTTIKSITGLSNSSTEEFVTSGIGNPWSKALSLKKGQRYYLVINKANDIETPFRILFQSKYKSTETTTTTTTITGIFKDDETGELIKNAHVTIEEFSGGIIAKTTSDSITGEFELIVPITNNNYPKKYILSGTKDTYFFTEETIIITPNEQHEPLNLVIPKLKKGKNLTLHNIHFVGDAAATLPSSEKSLKRLLHLMKQNNTLIIQIEGHTNGCSRGKLHAKKLSENRAKTVKAYLVSNGIDQSRITSIGYGCSKMLYPINSSQKNQALNRRVEIFVLEY